MKRRCYICREYFPRDGMLYHGLVSICTHKCMRTYRADISLKRKKSTKKKMPGDVRQAVLARDGNRCRFCRTLDSIHVHHIRYRSEGGPHVETNLITLCSDHHDLIHSNKRKWQPVLLAVIEEQYEEGHFYVVPEMAVRMGVEDAVWHKGLG